MHCEGVGSTHSAVQINGGLGKKLGGGSRPSPILSEGPTDKEIAEMLGISPERFVAALDRAGLRPCPEECDA